MDSQQVRWGVLGTGNIIAKGGNALHQSSNGSWLGVAGRNEANSRAAAEKYNVPRAYAGYEELLSDPDIDAVYIALLNHLHKEWAIRACEAGKHVLLEKPLAMTAADAECIRAAAERHGVLVQEALVWRYYDSSPAIRRMIEAGAIGELVTMRGHFSSIQGQRSTRWIKEWGGGSMYDIGCYPVSWARYFIGDEPWAASGCAVMDEKHGIDRRFTGTLIFSGGRCAHVESAFDMPHGSFFELLGTKGRLHIVMNANPERIVIRCTDGQGEEMSWTHDRITPFRRQAEHFAEAVLGRAPLIYGIDDAVNQAKAVDLLLEAAAANERLRQG
jgi:xylose dehydrogenase (NAD/NADP)